MSAKPKSILVTGANGFVGRYLCPAILERFPTAQLTAFVSGKAVAVPSGIRSIQGDIADERSVSQVVKAVVPDVVVHLAAQSSTAQAGRAEEAARRTNVGGSSNLGAAVAALERDCTFLFVSTSDVYGQSLNEGPANELVPLSPTSVYAQTKMEAELALQASLAESRAKLIVCRPFIHTGPGQDERFVVPALSAQVARLEKGLQPPIVIAGDLSVRRDLLDVRDVVEAYLGLIEYADDLPAQSIFNLASGQGTELIEIVNILRRHASRPFELSKDPDRLRPSEVPVAVGDAEKLRHFLNWQPRYRLEETVLAILEGFRRSC